MDKKKEIKVNDRVSLVYSDWRKDYVVKVKPQERHGYTAYSRSAKIANCNHMNRAALTPHDRRLAHQANSGADTLLFWIIVFSIGFAILCLLNWS